MPTGSVLDRIRIASPCPASWKDMKGDDRVRFCEGCRKNVYNLSALSRDEAERLIQSREGKLCALFYQRRDGTLLTADCPIGQRTVRERIALRFAAILAAVLTLFGLDAWVARTKEVSEPQISKVARSHVGQRELTDEEIEMLKQLGSLSYVDDVAPVHDR
jgi:hypothetical protein